MATHLKFSGRPNDEQFEAVRTMVRESDELMDLLRALQRMELRDCWIASGAIYQNIWNQLTGEPAWTGVKDIDVIYFDEADLSYEAEDRVIRKVEAAFPKPQVPIEVRNQARVHLWFEHKFGFPVPPLTSSTASLLRYASRSHAVAVRLNDDDNIEVEAPFGLDDIFSFLVTPNPAYANRQAHEAKGRRAMHIWPELQIIPWPASDEERERMQAAGG